MLVDPAMLILAPRLALEAVKEDAAKGVKGIVIVSAGFREVGDQDQAAASHTGALAASEFVNHLIMKTMDRFMKNSIAYKGMCQDYVYNLPKKINHTQLNILLSSR